MSYKLPVKSIVLELDYSKKSTFSPDLIRFRNFVLCTLLVTVFAVPRTLQAIKIGFLCILLVYILVKNKYKISYFLLSGGYALLFIPSLLVAIFLGNKWVYISAILRVNYFFPVLLFLVLQQFNFFELRKILKQGALISMVIVLVIFLSSVSNAFGLFPYNLNQYFYPNEPFVGIHDGYLHVINSSLSYLIFTIPLFFFGEKFSFKDYKIYLFFVMLIVAVVSGRRVLLLPFIIMFLFNFKKIIGPLVVLAALSFVLVNKEIYANFNLDKMISRFQDALEEKGDAESKGAQSKYFYRHIAERPITGNGLGAFMADYGTEKDTDSPFEYEKTWLYKIYSTGIPITVLHFIFFLTLCIFVFRNSDVPGADKKFNNALILSIISILVASSSNPYWLSSFDYGLPLAILMRYSQQDKPYSNLSENLPVKTI